MTTELVARDDTALAIRPDQQTFSVEQVDALKRQIGGEDIPDAELAVFFHQAKRTGLDPFARQIYIIPRKNRKKNRTDYTIQTSIDGLRLIADRTGRYAGSDRPIFEEREDSNDKCAVVTVWKIVQGQRVPYTAEAWWSEFVQTDYNGNPSNLWKTKPRLMLAKCAESLALRKAFPAEMSGLYTDDEMSQADAPQGASVHPINPELDASVARHPSSQLTTTGRAVDTETGEIVDVVEPSAPGDMPPPGPKHHAVDNEDHARPTPHRSDDGIPSVTVPADEKKRLAAINIAITEAFAFPEGTRQITDKIKQAKTTLLLDKYGIESTKDLTVQQAAELIDACKNRPRSVRLRAGLPATWDVPEDAA